MCGGNYSLFNKKRMSVRLHCHSKFICKCKCTSLMPVVPSQQNILDWIFLSASYLIFTLVAAFSQISHMVPRMDCLFPPNQLGRIIALMCVV